MSDSFEPFDLLPQLSAAVADMGYTTPTPIQSGVIPIMLAGRDVIGQAQTGTGKTAAFSLPLLQHIEPGLGFTQALVLAPTRELALQVSKALEDYARHMPVRVLTVYGGREYGPQIRQIKRGVDIIVGTPGRLLDLLNKNVLDLSGIRTLVLDEADEMLNMGFIEDIEAILEAVSAERQTALFSATMPPRIRTLAARYLREPEAVTISAEQRTVKAIEQRYYLVHEEDKVAALTRLFEVEDIETALIFTRTREGTGMLANELTVRGYPAEPLNGDLNQDARERVLDRFRDQKIQVLVATDVAARGLDIEHISHVFNYDVPQFPESYVHRVGRTGRAGSTGIAISLVSPRDLNQLRRIERFIRQQIALASLPSPEEIHARREGLLLENMQVWLNRGRCKREREIVEEMVATGLDPLEIAAVALKMARAEEKQRPIHTVREVDMRVSSRKSGRKNRPERSTSQRDRLGDERFKSKKSHEAGMARLVFKAGRTANIRPADVVATIAYNAEIPGSTIGAIKIHDTHTLVDIPEQFVGKVLARNGSYTVRRQEIHIERA